MESRHIISIALFVLAGVLTLVLGLGANNWLLAVVVGLIFLLAGIIFYRRGR